MMRRRSIATALAALGLCGVLSPLSPAAAGAEAVIPAGFADHKVTAGAYDPAFNNPIDSRFEYQAFYPSTLQVHRGDVVWFEKRGAHSITFFPDGAQQQTELFLRDEVPGEVAFHGATPSRTDCAMFDDLEKPPCRLHSPQQYLSSGVNFLGIGGMRAEVDLPEGSYSYFCKIHPGMRGEIEVVPESVPVASPEEVEADRVAQIRADTVAGEALIAAFDGPDFEVLDDGRVRWEVQVGGSTDDGRVSLGQFLPAQLSIEPGDEVEFVAGPMSQGAHEFHTATFMPRDQAVRFGFGNYMNFSCDPDDPHTGLPGVRTVAAAAFTGCPADSTSELILHPWAYQKPFKAPSNQVVGQAPYHDSGLIFFDDGTCTGRCDPWTGQELPDRSDAAFPAAGSYEVFCLIHAVNGMTATVDVADR